jgi:hypothetical protein
MIGVEGQYIFVFSIGGKEDFLEEEDLEEFTLIEEAGNVLPAWQLFFESKDKDLINVLNEGNDLQVDYGGDLKDETLTTKLAISSKRITRTGDQKYYICLKGVYSALPYITMPHTIISEKKPGFDILKATAGKYFSVETEDPPSSDKQYWVQPNITDKKFCDHLSRHMYNASSWYATGITSDGKFLIRDMKANIGKKEVFTFLPEGSAGSKTELAYLGDYELHSSAGFINAWHGYEREKPTYTIEDDKLEPLIEKVEPLLAQGTKFARLAKVEKRAALQGMQNENVHENYWKAALRNTMGLALFSSEMIELTITIPRFVKIKILDIVMFFDDELDKKDTSASYHSGLYATGLVSRTLAKKKFTTTIQIFRESHNTMKGALK